MKKSEQAWKKLKKIPYVSVSDQGLVKNHETGDPISTHKDSLGYARFKALGKFIRVDKMVALKFVPNPSKHRFIKFKDGNKENLVAKNLEWIDRKIANASVKTLKHYSDNRKTVSKFSEIQIKKIIRKRDAGKTLIQISEEMGISKQMIDYIHKNKERYLSKTKKGA